MGKSLLVVLGTSEWLLLGVRLVKEEDDSIGASLGVVLGTTIFVVVVWLAVVLANCGGRMVPAQASNRYRGLEGVTRCNLQI